MDRVKDMYHLTKTSFASLSSLVLSLLVSRVLRSWMNRWIDG